MTGKSYVHRACSISSPAHLPDNPGLRSYHLNYIWLNIPSVYAFIPLIYLLLYFIVPLCHGLLTELYTVICM